MAGGVKWVTQTTGQLFNVPSPLEGSAQRSRHPPQKTRSHHFGSAGAVQASTPPDWRRPRQFYVQAGGCHYKYSIMSTLVITLLRIRNDKRHCWLAQQCCVQSDVAHRGVSPSATRSPCPAVPATLGCSTRKRHSQIEANIVSESNIITSQGMATSWFFPATAACRS